LKERETNQQIFCRDFKKKKQKLSRENFMQSSKTN